MCVENSAMLSEIQVDSVDDRCNGDHCTHDNQQILHKTIHAVGSSSSEKQSQSTQCSPPLRSTSSSQMVSATHVPPLKVPLFEPHLQHHQRAGHHQHPILPPSPQASAIVCSEGNISTFSNACSVVAPSQCPSSMSSTSTSRTPRWRLCDEHSDHLTEMAPHGLHVYCCLKSVRPPSLETTIKDNVFICEYNLHKLTGTGMHRVKQVAKQDAAAHLLAQLYPQHSSLREVFMEMDREIETSQKNIKPLLQATCMDPCQLLNEVVTLYRFDRPQIEYLTDKNLYLCRMKMKHKNKMLYAESKDLNEKKVKKDCASQILSGLFPSKSLQAVCSEIDAKRSKLARAKNREKNQQRNKRPSTSASSARIARGRENRSSKTSQQYFAPRHKDASALVGRINTAPGYGDENVMADCTNLSRYPVTTVQDVKSGRMIRVRMVPVDADDQKIIREAPSPSSMQEETFGGWKPF